MIQFKKENEADRRTNDPEDSEGLEIEINDAVAAVISDDATDGVNEVPSMMSPSSKIKKKKKYGGLTKTLIVLTFAVAAIVIGVEASKAANRASTDLQLAMNQADSASSYSRSKSGKGCKDEFEVCVIDPIIDIIYWLKYLLTGGPFTVPDDQLPDADDFTKYLKKYNRNCVHFWAYVFYVIQYVIVSIINSLSDGGRRALQIGSEILMPADVEAVMDSAVTALAGMRNTIQGLMDSTATASAGMGETVQGLVAVPDKACVGLFRGLGALVVGEVCIKEIAEDIVGLDTAMDTCLSARLDMRAMQRAFIEMTDDMSASMASMMKMLTTMIASK